MQFASLYHPPKTYPLLSGLTGCDAFIFSSTVLIEYILPLLANVTVYCLFAATEIEITGCDVTFEIVYVYAFPFFMPLSVFPFTNTVGTAVLYSCESVTVNEKSSPLSTTVFFGDTL